MNDMNLNYLERQWLGGMQVDAVLDEIVKILVSKNLKLEPRMEFDYLLGFYSVVEIAKMIGFVKDLPEQFRNRHLQALFFLSKKQISISGKKSIAWKPLNELQLRLLRRIETGRGKTVIGSERLNAEFFEFIDLSKVIERDEDIRMFIGEFQSHRGLSLKGANISKRVKLDLTNPATLARALQIPPSERNRQDIVLTGFCKYIHFCEGLYALLTRLVDMPEVAEAMRLAHAHVLRQVNDIAGGELSNAIQSISKWEVETEDQAELQSRVNELGRLMPSLAVSWIPEIAAEEAYLKGLLEDDSPIGSLGEYTINFESSIQLDTKKLEGGKHGLGELTTKEEEAKILAYLGHANLAKAGEISQELGIGHYRIRRFLRRLSEKGYIGISAQEPKLLEQGESEQEKGAS